jgi:aryl-alcohol dehydrogenase
MMANASLPQFIPWLAERYAAGQFQLEKLQKTYKAEDINQACQDMVDGKTMKPILVW